MKKRYWFFLGDTHYPLGGMDDFLKDSDDLEELKKLYRDNDTYQWSHIYDAVEDKKILELYISSEFDKKNWSFSNIKYEWKEI